jgi:flavin-dependent dehydrogenase
VTGVGRPAAELPVVVVGAGPVGMTAAAMLARERIPVVVVEAEPVLKTDWRASTFHAATLELLEQIDITGQMLAEGLVVPTYQFRDRIEGLVASFDFGLLSDETRHPYRLQLNQQHLVRMLYQRLRRADGVELLLGARVTGVSDGGDVNYVADPRQWLFILRTPESWRALWPVPAVLPAAEVAAGHEIHHECELVVVVGRGGRDIPEESALDHVFGYAIGLDITVRSAADRSRRKSYDTFSPVGPWVTTADEVGAPDGLGIRLEVNGAERQRVDTATMITKVPALLAYASSLMTLLPGDLVFTGAPPGVGPIRAGDVLDARISRLGAMRLRVR